MEGARCSGGIERKLPAEQTDTQPSEPSSLHTATPNLSLKYPPFPSNPSTLPILIPFHLSSLGLRPSPQSD